MSDDRPLPPEVLADALQDRIHPSSGRFRAAKAVRRNTPDTKHTPMSIFKCPNCHDEVLPATERPCWKCGALKLPMSDDSRTDASLRAAIERLADESEHTARSMTADNNRQILAVHRQGELPDYSPALYAIRQLHRDYATKLRAILSAHQDG